MGWNASARTGSGAYTKSNGDETVCLRNNNNNEGIDRKFTSPPVKFIQLTQTTKMCACRDLITEGIVSDAAGQESINKKASAKYY